VFASEREVRLRFNWFAILSYAASLAISVAFWTGIFRSVEYLVR